MSLSKKEEDFLLTMEQKGYFVFNSLEANTFWGCPGNTANALSRLTHKKWLERLTRGVYLIRSLEYRNKEFTKQTKFLIASHLSQDAVVAYQSAMHFYGLKEASYNTNHFTVQTQHRKRSIQIHESYYHFININPEIFFDIRTIQLDTNAVLRITTPEKTLVDTAQRPSLCMNSSNILRFLQQFHSTLDWNHIDSILLNHHYGPAIKRLGYLIEKFEIPIPDQKQRLASWQNNLTQGVIQLEPKIKGHGHIHTRWSIEDNYFDKKESSK